MLDLSFDTDGKVILADFDSVGAPVVVPTADLGVVIAFQQIVDGIPLTRMVRLLEDGSLHQGFGIGGVVTITTLGSFRDLVIQGDGKPVLIGRIINALDTGVMVERFLENGDVDSSYGIQGSVLVHASFENANLKYGGIILPDERLVLRLSDRIIRLDQSGVVDPTFGVQGVLLVPTGVGPIALSPNSRLRWTSMGNNVPNEVDFDGQEQTIGYLLNGPPVGPDSRIYGPIAINHFDQTMGHCGGMPIPPGISGGVVPSYGFGKAVDLQYVVDHHGQANHRGVIRWMPAFINGSYNSSSVSGFLGPVTVDQSGNFLMAFSYLSYTYWNPFQTVVPLQPVWKVKRNIPSSGNQDASFGIGFNPQDSTGVDASFDPASIPKPRSMVVQPDGRVVVAGTSNVAGINRIVLARYHNIPDPRSTLSLRMFLGGAYDASTGLMRDDLRQQDLLPALQPYGPPFYPPANGVGPWAVPQHVLDVEGEDAVVDWVWLELINASDSSNVMATRVGLVHRNGTVTSADGHSPIDFSAGTGSYFVRVRHRNHLGVTIAEPLTQGASVTTVDLTDPATATFGTDAQQEVNGVRMLWPGDATSDAAIKYVGPFNDRDRILVAIGGSNVNAVLPGYRTEDVNLDGVVKYVGTANDRDVILQVLDGSINAVRLEQRP